MITVSWRKTITFFFGRITCLRFTLARQEKHKRSCTRLKLDKNWILHLLLYKCWFVAIGPSIKKLRVLPFYLVRYIQIRIPKHLSGYNSSLHEIKLNFLRSCVLFRPPPPPTPHHLLLSVATLQSFANASFHMRANM